MLYNKYNICEVVMSINSPVPEGDIPRESHSWKERITSKAEDFASKTAYDLRYLKKIIQCRAVACFGSVKEKMTIHQAKSTLKDIAFQIHVKRFHIERKMRRLLRKPYLMKLNEITIKIKRDILSPVDRAIRQIFPEKVSALVEKFNTTFRAEGPVDHGSGIAVDVFMDNSGKGIAKETAVRINTMDILAKSLETKPSGQYETDTVKDMAERYHWGSTNTPRFNFMHNEREVAKNEALPILCNLRMQTLKNEEGQVISAVSRSAAISDFSHGEISLRELQDYLDLIRLKNRENIGMERSRDLWNIYGFDVTDPNVMDNVINDLKTRALVSYGPERLLAPAAVNEVKDAVDKLVRGDELLDNDTRALREAVIDEAMLSQVVRRRTEHLEFLILQDLYAHFQQRPVAGADTLYGRVALLDMQKSPKNEFGCILYERTQGLDMKAIFDAFEGREVRFDLDSASQGPYIDDAGRVHMPREFASEGRETTRLHTVLFNTSVQGHTNNVGIQEWINDDAMKKIARLKDVIDLDANHETFALFDGERDSFKAPLKAIKWFQEAGGYVGVNCYGGKDRTGYLVALLTQQYLKESIPENDPSRRKLLRRWGRQLVSKTGVAASIARENANHSVVKVMSYGLELYDTSTLKGHMQRVADLIKESKLFLKTKFTGGIQESKVKGQLYHRSVNQ